MLVFGFRSHVRHTKFEFTEGTLPKLNERHQKNGLGYFLQDYFLRS